MTVRPTRRNLWIRIGSIEEGKDGGRVRVVIDAVNPAKFVVVNELNANTGRC